MIPIRYRSATATAPVPSICDSLFEFPAVQLLPLLPLINSQFHFFFLLPFLQPGSETDETTKADGRTAYTLQIDEMVADEWTMQEAYNAGVALAQKCVAHGTHARAEGGMISGLGMYFIKKISQT